MVFWLGPAFLFFRFGFEFLFSGPKVPVTFRARKAVMCCSVFIQDQSFNNFENNTMKLLVNDAKLTGLWARNRAILRPRKVSGRFEKQAPGYRKQS